MFAKISARTIPSIFALLTGLAPASAGGPEVKLQMPGSASGKARVTWTQPPAEAANALGGQRMLLETSTDLKNWFAVGDETLFAPGGTALMAVDAPVSVPHQFFRVKHTDTPVFLAKEGAEVFGYTTALAERAAANTGVTPTDVPLLYPGSPALDHVSFDVTKAEYFPEWNTDPVAWNASLPADSKDKRLTDFRLNADALQKLTANGFVVSEERGAPSFTDLYYRIWMDDLPVFVTSDSILHAWHRTWVTLLEEIEEFALRPQLAALLAGATTQVMSAPVPDALAAGKADAVDFLTTGRALLFYNKAQPGLTEGTWAAKAQQASSASSESIFGSSREVDWPLFAPRSHYDNSETLRTYFRGMTWLSTVDCRIDQKAESDASLRELSVAVVLTLTLRDSGLMDEWEEIDRLMTAFVGRSDSLTPPQLLEILQSENLASLDAFTTPAVLENLLARIRMGQAGVQDIQGHPIPAPLAEVKRVLPRSFSFFSQKFTPESWAFGRLLFDQIWRANTDPDGPAMKRVLRRLPSALDVNFAVMGNNTPSALLAQRMNATAGVLYRDGHDFSQELVSVREVIDSQTPGAWGGTLYLHQLAALRQLSEPLPASVPEALRTQAWNWKTVQTQLAGWTELRHDNLLYAKQSYTPPVLCYYPAGYVEPRPAFFAAMKQLVDFATGTLSTVSLSGTYTGRAWPEDAPEGGVQMDPVSVDLAARKAQWLANLSGMSGTLASLTEIAQAEVDQQPFSEAQTTFIRDLVQRTGDYGSGGRTYSGWYPKMYLTSAFAREGDPHPSEKWDPLVADVHTDAGPDALTGDPGAVLYNATGNAALMLVAIDVKGQLCLHGGPSFTYYEFTGPYGTEARLNDTSWKQKVRDKAQPAHPEWTSSWLTPGPITVPFEIQ